MTLGFRAPPDYGSGDRAGGLREERWPCPREDLDFSPPRRGKECTFHPREHSYAEEPQPGDQILRRELHERYGGRQQGGIGPSSKAPVILFFTDPAAGHRHGYYDGWDDDGLFNYYGEGQLGDQRLVQGNKAILNHKTDGRTLEGFLARGTTVTYFGTSSLSTTTGPRRMRAAALPSARSLSSRSGHSTLSLLTSPMSPSREQTGRASTPSLLRSNTPSGPLSRPTASPTRSSGARLPSFTGIASTCVVRATRSGGFGSCRLASRHRSTATCGM